ncbi:lysylphosphatidylglycerol synthase transmembrane domain-containing protein [Streptomyces sp. NPDC059582]|uniref:lysylphosphatidylglycerol synthase transmembrane domain-containing protein n=1 Tax=Streptomyces sp. NPDC059582 TaxID=3346875 RepID=UPI0036B109E0
MTAETVSAQAVATTRPTTPTPRTAAGRAPARAGAAVPRSRVGAIAPAAGGRTTVRPTGPAESAATGFEAAVVSDATGSETPASSSGATVSSSEAAAVAERSRGGLLRVVRTHLGTVAGVAILGVLLWRLGTGVFLDGLRRIDAVTLLVSVGIGAVTTVFSAWRWALVARGLRLRLPLGPAVADYYRALFLNAALPGGVLGDVHRAVRHGQSAGDLGRGVRAVVLERVAGQIALAVAGVTVLLTLPSPVMDETRHLVPLVALGALGALAVVLALRMNRVPSASRRGRALRATLAEAREGLMSRRNGPGVALSSVVVLAGHLTMFVLAARVVGAGASVLVLLPLAVLALVAMGVPLNVGGFGPREGVTVWAFGAAGLGASNGLAVAVVYGVLSFVAALPGALVLVVRWYQGLRAPAPGTEVADPAADDRTPDDRTAGDRTADDRAPAAGGRTPGGDYPRPSPGRPATASSSPAPSAPPEPSLPPSSAKYAPKESVRLANSAFPFSAEPSEGRPMTPESV